MTAIGSLPRYELWVLQNVPAPPRSRLYSLPPVGLGTPYVESLTGYVERLSKAHGVPVVKLVRKEIAPVLATPYLMAPDRDSVHTFFRDQSVAINSTQTLASNWTQVLQELTG